MSIVQRHVKLALLEQAITWSNNMLVQAFSNAELPASSEVRVHIKKALEELALAELKIRIDK